MRSVLPFYLFLICFMVALFGTASVMVMRFLEAVSIALSGQ